LGFISVSGCTAAVHWKSRKLLLILLNWTEVLQKKVWEAFWVNPCFSGWFLACAILGCFVNFLDDPYYELPYTVANDN